MFSSETGATPVDNAAFAPAKDALAAPPFAGRLRLDSTAMRTLPALANPVLDGRDARLFPGVSLGFVTLGDVLVPLERGEMVRETAAGKVPSYWRVIPQFGRVWREQRDGDWSRAAFPLMLVNDTENHAHQGLATFLYQDGKVTCVARAVRAADGALPDQPAQRAVGFDPGDGVSDRPGAHREGTGSRHR